ncbi:Os02g0736150, partial [Oryza sativa Japonica Group]
MRISELPILIPHFVLQAVELDLDGIRPVHQREELVGVQPRRLHRPAPSRGAPERRRAPLLPAAAVRHLRSEPRRRNPPSKSRASLPLALSSPRRARRAE